MKKSILFVAIITSVSVFSCKKEKGSSGGGPDGTALDCGTVKFATTILPLITSRCATAGCHDAASSNGPGPLTNYAQVFASRVQISSAVNANRMPQTGAPLTSTQKLQITCWIDAGAPNN
jgi:hypothetical protein